MDENEVMTDEMDKEFLEGFNEGDAVGGDDEDDGFNDTEEEKEEPEEEKEPEEVPPEVEEQEPEKSEEPEEEPPKEPEKEEAKAEPLKVPFLGEVVEVAQEDIPDLVMCGLNEKRMEAKLKVAEENAKYIDEFLVLASYYNMTPREFIKTANESFRQSELTKLQEEGMSEARAQSYYDKQIEAIRASQPKPNNHRNLKPEIDDLFKARPDLIGMKKFPDEVATMIDKGMVVKDAYFKYEAKKLTQEKEQMEKDLNAQITDLKKQLKQKEIEEKTSKAPKKIGGTGGSNKIDPFLAGFNEGY